MKQKILRLLPGFAAPVLALAVNLFAYYLPRLLPALRGPVNLETALDRAMPFVPFFIVFYAGAYLQWAIYYVETALDERPGRARFAAAEILSKGLCLALFLLLPAVIERPAAQGGDVFSRLVRLIYSIDTPECLFPSIHCLQSWICMRYAFWRRSLRSPLAWSSAAFSVLVCLSTVYVKQHFALDAIAGILAAEAGLFLADRTGLTALLDRMTEKLRRVIAARA